MSSLDTTTQTQQIQTQPEQTVRSHRGTPTWEIAYLFPTQGHWSEADYLALDTNCLVEFTEGTLEFLPMPPPFHQLIVRYLVSKLEAHVRQNASGYVLFAPLAIRLAPETYREPDVIYLKPERMLSVHRPPDGADLVMEVVSEGAENHRRDIETKRTEYAQAGIAEYWIVDPQQKQISVLSLNSPEKTYRVHGEFGTGQKAESVLLPGFAVSVDELLAAGEAEHDPSSPVER